MNTPNSLPELVDQALSARNLAYAPYSNFRVGCCVVADGNVFVGANVENISYGLTICAERNAIMRAVQTGNRNLETIIIASQCTPPAPPCGMCLQTMREFCESPDLLQVICVNIDGHRLSFTLGELLPQAFQRL